MPAIFDILPTFSESPYSYIIVPIILVVSIIGFYYKPVFHALLLHPYEICRGKRLHTVLTSALIHRNWLHLLINAVLIYFLLFDLYGLIEQEQSAQAALLLSLLLISSFIGVPNLIQSYVKKNDFGYTAVGSSGLTFALYGFSFTYFPLEKTQSFWIEGIKTNSHLWLATLIVILLLAFIPKSKINRGLHLVAFLLGSISAILVRPQSLSEFIESYNFLLS